ncbi:hypothetical protein [Nocardioides sp. SYSU DS0663]|uniref:hypothetical protein n=1 Tax=Nocardioides sp. SYSU DS0663 TaxID=3416445 RepID=UPI003F4C06FE
MNPTRPLLALASSAVLLSGMLSGCGVAGTGFSPGVAAEVGDAEISLDRVEELASAYCRAIEPQLEGQPLPNSYLLSGVAGQLTLVEAAQQLAEEHGVEPGPEHRARVAELEQEPAIAALPEDQREAVVEIESTSSLLADLVIGVGERIASEEGLAGGNAEQVAALGNQALTDWIEENEVDVNPVYGVELRDAQPVPADTSTSVAVGDVATTALAESPDAEYAASLPESQRCG